MARPTPKMRWTVVSNFTAVSTVLLLMYLILTVLLFYLVHSYLQWWLQSKVSAMPG